MANRTLSLEAFRVWLVAKHERTKVGNAECQESCPLAKFLTQTTGEQYEVDGETYVPLVKDEYDDLVADESRRLELPLWAQHFVEQVDSRTGSVSAMRALRIVESTTLGRAARM